MPTGKIQPAKVLIVGAGVAGLAAIQMAKKTGTTLFIWCFVYDYSATYRLRVLFVLCTAGVIPCVN